MKTRALFCLLSLFPVLIATGTNWPNQRGPHFNGSGGEDLKLPAKFSPTENVDWKAKLPGTSSATPVVWGDHVFVNAVDHEKKEIHAICLSSSTGKVLWSHVVGKGRVHLDDRSDFSSPSPVTDGKHVAFFFGNADLIVYDMKGKEVWRRNIVPEGDKYFAFQWTFSTSPILFEGTLIMQVLQRDVPFSFAGVPRGKDGANNIPSYLEAFDFATGKPAWKVERKGQAVAESLEAFTTPVIAPTSDSGDKLQLLVAGGDALSGHEPGSGKELWRWGTWNPGKIGHWRLVPSPVAGKGVALACAPKKSPVYAVDIKTGELLWKSKDKEVSSDVCTPLYHDGYFYVLNGEFKDKRLSCIEPRSGKVLWMGEIGSRSKIEASPTCGDGKIYFQDHNGEVFVVAADPKKFNLLHRVQFGDKSMRSHRASLALANNRVFLRSKDTLYCLGK